MDKYTIYCTEAQTKLALELGAPIVRYNGVTAACAPTGYCLDGNTLITIHTAEQMIGWLESQEAIRCVEVTESFGWHYRVKKKHDDTEAWIQGTHKTRQEATLAAIDAALEYLTKKK